MTTRKELLEAMQSLPDYQSNAIHSHYRKACESVSDLLDLLDWVRSQSDAINNQCDQVRKALDILEAMPLGMIPQTEKGGK